MPEQTVEITATPAQVWEVWTAVADWPHWNSTVRTTTVLDDPGTPFGLGSRVRIHQTQLPAAVWTVAEWRPATRFVWIAAQAGVTTTATHDLVALPDGRTRVHARVHQHGLLAGIVGALTGRLAGTLVAREVADLQRHCEGGDTPARRPPPSGLRH